MRSQGQHIPLVSREEFARVQQTIARRNRSFPHIKYRPEFPLRGLVRCHQCRRYLTGGFSRGRSRHYPYYNCGFAECENRGKSYTTKVLHDEFEVFLNSIAPKPDLVEKLGELVLRAAEERLSLTKTKKARQEAELGRLHRQIQELIRMKTENLITDQEFLAQKSILAERRTVLESTPVPDRIDRDKLRKDLGEITEPLAQLRETWEYLPDLFRHRFERLILPVGFVNGETRTAELGLLFAAFRELSEVKTNGVPLVGKFLNQILAEIKSFSSLIKDYQEAWKQSKGPVLTNSSE